MQVYTFKENFTSDHPLQAQHSVREADWALPFTDFHRDRSAKLAWRSPTCVYSEPFLSLRSSKGQ